MEMEFMAEFTEGMSRDRARQIIKRKRTKRPRPSSPFDGDCLIDNFDESLMVSSKEDEDMANCLIMLAQSVSPVTEERYSNQIRRKTEKLSSQRLTEMEMLTRPYVYECKTCNRTFPSFQALGGHRASHKKPKVNVCEKKSSLVNIQPPLIEYVEQVQHHDLDQHEVVEDDEENKASVIVTNNVIINNKGKVHECSICGSEFLSGQALGGHMRKHRPIPPSVNRTGISTTTDDNITDQIIEKSPAASSNNNMLSLDLNFPPPEDDLRSTFQFTGGSSQPHLVFSAPAVVDCHY